MYRFLALITLLIMSFSTFAQFEFSGKIISEKDTPLVGAVIRFGTNDGTVTNDDGEYIFESNKNEVQGFVSYLGSSLEYNFVAGTYQTVVLPEFTIDIEPVFVSVKYPITQTTVSADEREEINLGQDLPILLDQLPSVVTTSDAGAGVGYTGIRVRGSDASRINVTINSIPLNDSESQGVFWVNMPDFSSSTENITLVRGVGTSTNGAGAFGGSVHISTEEMENTPYAEYNGSVGSFNTFKNNVKLNTGEKNGWSANTRLSKITSDGFIDRASSDLQGYFVQAKKRYQLDGKNGEIKFVNFAGHEQTYQAWYGVTREQMENEGRTYNPYTYENQEDNYKQKHYQLLGEQELSENLLVNIGLHYTKGEGYFEEFKEEESLLDYGINPISVGSEIISETDLVRRRWLDNDFYGVVASVDYFNDIDNLIIGGALNNYEGGHFGEIIQGKFVPQENIGANYYNNDATKRDGNIYAKYTRDIERGTTTIRPFIDLQYRNVNYDFVGLSLDGSGNIQDLPQNVTHNFFNPKLGVSVDYGDTNLYASYARAEKEPNRNDYTDSPNTTLPESEKLNDFELGFNYQPNQQMKSSINVYYMGYNDQLAVTGGVNDVGEYSRVNVDKSYRTGVELMGRYSFGLDNSFHIGGNATFSANKVDEFVETIDNYEPPYTPILVTHKDTDLALSPNVIAGGSFGYTHPKNIVSATLLGKYVGKQYLDNTSSDSRSIDSYFVNNLNASLNLGEYIPSVKKVQFNLLVNNLFDVEYESNGYTFGYNYGGLIYENYYYPQAGINVLFGTSIRF